MTWQRDLIDHAARLAVRDPSVMALRVTGSAADPSPAAIDTWSDVDLVVQVRMPVDSVEDRWVSSFGRPWALTRDAQGDQVVLRVIYDDGRRLDLVMVHTARAMPAGRDLYRRDPHEKAPSALRPGSAAAGPARPSITGTVDAEVMAVRFMAALAVVKLARQDLLIGMHLSLELVRRCLVQAMVLRDRQTGTNSHRMGGPFNDVVAELDALRRHPWTLTGALGVVRDVVPVYDSLARQLDADYMSDWSGLSALLDRVEVPS